MYTRGKASIWAIAAIFMAILTLAAGISFFVWLQSKPDGQGAILDFNNSFFAFPGNNTPQNVSPGTGTGPNTEGSMTVAGRDGTSITVRNFLNDPGVMLTGTSTSDGGYYIVAEPYPEGVTPIVGGEDAEYEILYLPADSSFLIALLREPIGEVRRKAADDLKQRLGLSDSELCKIVVEVGTPTWVNEFFGARSLGLPGCPGAVPMGG